MGKITRIGTKAKQEVAVDTSDFMDIVEKGLPFNTTVSGQNIFGWIGEYNEELIVHDEFGDYYSEGDPEWTDLNV